MTLPLLYLEEQTPDFIDWRVFIRHNGNDNYTVYSTRRPENSEKSDYPYYTFQIQGVLNLIMYITTVFDKYSRFNSTLFMADRQTFMKSGIHFESLYKYYDTSLHGKELVGFDNMKLSSKYLTKVILALKNIS